MMKNKSRDGKVRVYIQRQDGLIHYKDENEFMKHARAVRKYFGATYKHFLFKAPAEVDQYIKDNNVKDNVEHKIELPTDNMFRNIYGKMYLVFTKIESSVYYKRIEPVNVLKALHSREVPVKDGVPIVDHKAQFKLAVLNNVIGCDNE